MQTKQAKINNDVEDLNAEKRTNDDTTTYLSMEEQVERFAQILADIVLAEMSADNKD